MNDSNTPGQANAGATPDELRRQLTSAAGNPATNDYVRAWWDWYLGLATQPGRQLELARDAIARGMDTWQYAMQAAQGKASPHGNADARFRDEAWNQFPFNVLARNHAQLEQWSRAAREAGAGMSDENALRLEFMQRQALDAASPAHYLLTNPELLRQTRDESGANLLRGAQLWLEDAARMLGGGATPGSENFRVGEQVAVTPGKVVYRNALMELIQYSPQAPDVHAEPVLIVPAWIMKYYILDLSARNSMVKYLVDQGHTVFMMSWKNPDADDRGIGMDDYVEKGFRAAVDAVSAIVPKRKIHAVGYCIGGTLLSIGAATLARDGDDRLASMTMFAAQTDFSEPGELAFFINPSQLAMLEASMHRKGVLESKQMGGAFALLRSQDLLWQPAVNNYVKGQRDPMIDLMAWNADGTRMPWRMHTEYLYRLYLDNELATNRFPVHGKLVRLSDIGVPMFLVGTETDHVAPWKSVYKTDNLVRSDDFTFLLTSGGHNAGIVSGPVHPKRHYRIKSRRLKDPHLAPEDWLEAATKHEGSWWPAWQAWLARHSTGQVKPPAIGAPAKGYAPIEDAPGTYVRQR